MDLKNPRPKKHFKLRKFAPLPVVKKSNSIQKFNGIFNGFSVVICNREDAECINRNGFFGKANLSRSFVSRKATDVEIIRKRQYINRNKHKSEKIRKVIVVPDSESENDDYFTNLKPEYQIDRSNVTENLHLSLVEAYFLCDGIDCLNVHFENKQLDNESLWRLFCSTDKYFEANYVAYYHFRRKNWVVKPGVKFGGDFLLYKDGPPFYHASYVVIIDILNENLVRRKDMQRRSMDFIEIIGLNRLCETTGKELLICQLIWPEDIHILSAKDIKNISVNEVIMRRCHSMQEK